MFSIIVSAAAEGDDGGSQAQGPPGYGQAVSLCRSVTVPLETVMSIAMEAFFVAVMSVLIGADDMGIRDGRALFTFMTGFGRFDTVLGRFHLSFGCFNPAFQFGLPAGQLLLAFPDFRLLPLQFPLLFGCLASLVVIRLRRCFCRPQEKLGLGRNLHVGDVPDAFFIDPDVFFCLSAIHTSVTSKIKKNGFPDLFGVSQPLMIVLKAVKVIGTLGI